MSGYEKKRISRRDFCKAAGAAALFLFNATAVLAGLGLLVVCGRRRADSAS